MRAQTWPRYRSKSDPLPGVNPRPRHGVKPRPCLGLRIVSIVRTRASRLPDFTELENIGEQPSRVGGALGREIMAERG
jgi:hypothetical protein